MGLRDTWQLFKRIRDTFENLESNFSDKQIQSKKISNNQELIKSDPVSCLKTT